MGTSLTPLQAELRSSVQELDALEAVVNERLKPVPSKTRQLNYRLSESFIFHSPEMKVQKKTFINGAEDLYLDRMSFAAVFRQTENTGSPFSLGDAEAGLGGFTLPNSLIFDFFWNYSIGSTVEAYATTANDVPWLSRKSLANKDRARVLPFLVPLRLKGGDSITFTVKPAFWAFGGDVNDEKYDIALSLTMFGRRNGRMAESAYDPDFRSSYRQKAELAAQVAAADRMAAVKRGRK